MQNPLSRCVDAIGQYNSADSPTFDVMSGIIIVKNSLDIRSFLTEASLNIEYCAKVARDSYSHSNGFDKFVLHKEENWKLRLHIWWQGDSSLKSDLHNHNWNFGSWILAGALRTTIFRVEANGAERRTHLRCRPSEGQGGSNYSFSNAKRVALTPIFSTVHPPNTTYFIDHREIHSGDPYDDQLTATIVLQTAPLVRETDVFVAPEKASHANETVGCEKFDADQVSKKLRRLLDRLNQGDL